MAIVTQTEGGGSSADSGGLMVDEFLPIVKFKNPSRYTAEDEQLIFSEEDITLSKYLDSDKQTFTILQLTTNKNTLKLPFSIKKGITFTSVFEQDDDGYIEPKLSINDENFKIISDLKILKKYGDEIEVELNLKGSKTTEFYLDFFANDDEDDFNKGEYENVHCGRIKIIFEFPNEWEFSKEKIEEIREYAFANNAKNNGPGNENRYHHCTDTHKHIVYKLLDNPNDLNLGKDQNHLPSANRIIPNDFVKAGESTTRGIREKLIATTYAEPSKTFTVIDANDNEVLTSNGQAGNTDNELKNFKESPIEYIKTKCPDNGCYVFIGAYNDDYHSFTIIANRKGEKFKFEFVDQIVGALPRTCDELENRFLTYIYGWRNDFPMKLEIYQLRNKKR